MPTAIEKADVFTAGEGGFNVYRIPSLAVTTRGTLLAFCEGRRSISDAAENAIVMKRSTDGGKTWEGPVTVARMGRDSLNNPTAIVVRDSGKIILFFQRYPFPSRELKVVHGPKLSWYHRLLGFRVLDAWMMSSDDDGISWSPPRDITSQVKPSIATSLASGPGIGIQLRRGPRAGRLVVPFNCGPFWRWRVFVAFSDDGGETWATGTFAPDPVEGHGNEVQAVELADGRLMLNARKQGGKQKARLVATSVDAGETWTPLVLDPALPDPACQGSIARHSDPLDGEPSIIIFANPASESHREHGVLRASHDEGSTWPVAVSIEPGNFAYCCLGVLPGKTVACLYETGEKGGYEKIVLARIRLDG